MTDHFGMTPLPASADVVVIGGGVVGCAIARELSRHALSIVVIESAPDVATGTSKANSGILHAGFDADAGTWKARLNVRGAALYKDIAEGLGIARRETGSLVVARTEADRATLEALRRRGVDNGVPGLELWSREQLLTHEPNVSPEAQGALWAPTGAVACPFLATIGFAENAIRPPDKTLLAPLRLLDVLAIFYLVECSSTAAWLSETRIGQVLAVYGRHSLEVFSLGTFFDLLGKLAFTRLGNGWVMQGVVNLIGLGALYALAVWLDNRKQVQRRAGGGVTVTTSRTAPDGASP